MDDVIAVRVRDSKRRKHYFVTWGRVLDPLHPKSVESLVRKYAPQFGISGNVAVQVCSSLRDASRAPYFFEALVAIGREPIPFGKRTYETWRRRVAKRMLSGKDLIYCGRPDGLRNQSPDPTFASGTSRAGHEPRHR
jgi:hypothetical protein